MNFSGKNLTLIVMPIRFDIRVLLDCLPVGVIAIACLYGSLAVGENPFDFPKPDETLPKKYDEYLAWMEQEKLLASSRMANRQAVFRARLVCRKTVAENIAKEEPISADLVIRGHVMRRGKYFGSRLNSDTWVAALKNCAIYVPNRLGPSNGFYLEKPPLEVIRYLSIGPDGFDRSMIHVYPFTEGLKIVGPRESFDKAVCARLRIFGDKTPSNWPDCDAIVEFDALEPKPILIEDSKDPRRRTFVIPQYYAAFSDSNGDIEIQGLEADSTIKFCFFHPILGNDFAGVDIAGEKIDDEGSIELTLGIGLNDFGNVYVSPAIARHLPPVSAKPP